MGVRAARSWDLSGACVCARVRAIWLDVCNKIPSSLHLPYQTDGHSSLVIYKLLTRLKTGFVQLLNLHTYVHVLTETRNYIGNLVHAVQLDLRYIFMSFQ